MFTLGIGVLYSGAQPPVATQNSTGQLNRVIAVSRPVKSSHLNEVFSRRFHVAEPRSQLTVLVLETIVLPR